MQVQNCLLQTFELPAAILRLYEPEEAAVRAWYTAESRQHAGIPFPYWAKVWHSSVALAAYLHNHPELIRQQTVVELAAGLGLAGLATAAFARHVVISDYVPEAVDLIAENIRLNKLGNAEAASLDWNQLPPALRADVLLLSDINYDPSAFDTLHKVLLRFLQAGTAIILATPQRLMAKPFIEQLLPYVVTREEQLVTHAGQAMAIQLLVLKAC
jgi:predicted nicotinamide N-methyase